MDINGKEKVDIMILGATGYCGRRITNHLHTHPQRVSFTLTVAARSKEKLDKFRKELGLGGNVEAIVVDVTKQAEVNGAVRRTRVVVNAVGPYWWWGEGVVKACAENGVHYVDITGETAWVRRIIEEYDLPASKTHAIILPSTGLSSLPSDLAVYLSALTLHRVLGARTTTSTSSTALEMRGAGSSGGAQATALVLLEEVPREEREATREVHCLSPLHGRTSSPMRALYSLPRAAPGRRVWGFPVPLAPHNSAVVQRSWGLLQMHARQREGGGADAEVRGTPNPTGATGTTETTETTRTGTREADTEEGLAEEGLEYGPDFTYEEFMAAPGRVSALLLGGAVRLVMACLEHLRVARWLFRRLALKPGEGPSEAALERGHLTVRNITISTVPVSNTEPPTTTPAEDARTVVETVIRARGDPGFALTPIMAAEAALVLLDTAALPALARRGGVLTPATALGSGLAARLRATGRFEIESRVVSGSGKGFVLE